MEKPKAYVVKMSAKNSDVPIDADEVYKVVQGIMMGMPIKCRRGLVNPSFYVGIYEDTERINEYMRELNAVIANNDHYDKYQIGHREPMPEFKQLKDIFDGIQLPSGNVNKKLTN